MLLSQGSGQDPNMHCVLLPPAGHLGKETEASRLGRLAEPLNKPLALHTSICSVFLFFEA